MNRKRNLWIFIGIVVITAALISGFILMQASAEDILVQTIETAKNITAGHAIVEIDVDTPERDASGIIEIWALRGEGSEDPDQDRVFRVQVLEASEEKAQGAVIVSDGETLWAYSPSENKVFVGDPEEAQKIMEENEFMAGEINQFYKVYESEDGDHRDGDIDEANYEHPESAEEAVTKLLEYFNISKSGNEIIAGETANQLKLEPIPEQMPDEYIAVGGFVNLWISKDGSLPMAVSYTGGSMGEFSATVLEYDVNSRLDRALFTFEIPAGAEIVTFADLEPQSLTLDEAGAAAEFELLTPAETPEGATLVDILDVRGTIVQRYALPEGGSFSIAQGIAGENYDGILTPSMEMQSVELRDTTGNLLISEDGVQVFLTWAEGDLFYSVAGNLTSDEALRVAESLQ